MSAVELTGSVAGGTGFLERGGSKVELASETRNKGVVETSLPDNIFRGILSPSREYSVNRDKDADAAHVSGVNFAKRKKCQRLIQRERGGSLVGNMGRTIVNSDPCPRVCHALA